MRDRLSGRADSGDDAAVPPLRPFGNVPTLASLALLTLLTLGAPRTAQATTDRGARIELVTNATLWGIGLGVYTSVELELKPRPTAWIAAALGGGMLYGSLTLADRLSLTAPNVRFVESAGAWTAVDAILTEFAFDVDDGLWVPTAFAGSVLGAGAALATRNLMHGSEGQISLVNTGGLFTPVGGLLLGATLHLGDGSHLPRDLLLLNLVGLGTGVALSQKYDPTRNQVLYLDGGMLLGGLCGGLVGGIMAIGVDSWEPITGLGLVGMGLGGWIAISNAGFDKAGRKKHPNPETVTTAMMFPLAAGVF